MKNLTKLFEEYANIKQSLILNITWDKIADWCVYIEHQDSNTIIFDENGVSLELVCAKAFIKLAEWGEEFKDLENILYNIF